MKFFYLLSIAVFTSLSAKAIVHIILAEGTTIPTDIFTPAITYAEVGDTITWVWVDGIHTTESVTIPAGAASWSANLDNSNATFSYVVTVPGSYYFDCHAAFSHGMDGYIEVSNPTGINNPAATLASEVFPNPFTNKLTVKTAKFDRVEVYNIAGALLQSYSNNRPSISVDMDLSDLPTGIYFVGILEKGALIETQKVIKQ